jgi:hypothetical protein
VSHQVSVRRLAYETVTNASEEPVPSVFRLEDGFFETVTMYRTIRRHILESSKVAPVLN